MRARWASGFVSVAAVVLMPSSASAALQEQGQGPTKLDEVRRASLILGAEVLGPGNERGLGTVEDLIMDERGVIRFVLISRGDLPGMVEDRVPVPAGQATFSRIDETRWQVHLGVPGDRLDEAPKLGEDPVGVLAQDERRSAIDSHFAQDEGGVVERPPGEPGGRSLARMSRLLGAEVGAAGGGAEDPVAAVEDLLIDAEGRIVYAVLDRAGATGPGKSMIPVPAGKLRIVPDSTGEMVEVRSALGSAHLDRAPSLDGEWNKMLNGSFVAGVTNCFADVPSLGEAP
ncbi:PRC-barrel domain-containing protein [Tautonia plasticadhaerens]|uniref:PRC-barrel domain protein n=1 Tax=Tautonia plasticadhaerens TaxID=2527974 RepID=A0A518H955_9BACT|nr:PRC-barrel domain-containing protein [Tautonia plasticadhaerens]QDV37373.1 PRC-barrel domain protein [Tautonia plasticadhaerens]